MEHHAARARADPFRDGPSLACGVAGSSLPVVARVDCPPPRRAAARMARLASGMRLRLPDRQLSGAARRIRPVPSRGLPAGEDPAQRADRAPDARAAGNAAAGRSRCAVEGRARRREGPAHLRRRQHPALRARVRRAGVHACRAALARLALHARGGGGAGHRVRPAAALDAQCRADGPAVQRGPRARERGRHRVRAGHARRAHVRCRLFDVRALPACARCVCRRVDTLVSAGGLLRAMFVRGAQSVADAACAALARRRAARAVRWSSARGPPCC